LTRAPRRTHSHFIGQNHVRGKQVYAQFYRSNLYGVMSKVTFLFHRAFALIISQNCYQILFITFWNRWWHGPTLLKSSVPTLTCWTQIAHSILIRLKQALPLQNTEIWTEFNLLRIMLRICIIIALLNLLLYFVLEKWVLLSLKLYRKIKKTKKCDFIHSFASLWHNVLFA